MYTVVENDNIIIFYRNSCKPYMYPCDTLKKVVTPERKIQKHYFDEIAPKVISTLDTIRLV